MMTRLFFTNSFYILGIFLFYGSNTLFSFWILIELNLLFFLVVVYLFQGKDLEFFSYRLFYFLVQSLGSVLFLLSILLQRLDLDHSFDLVLVFSLILKIGLYPGTFWVFQMGCFFSFRTMYYLLVFQKIPLFILLFTLSPLFLEAVLILSFIYGSLYLFFSKSLRDVFIRSSIASTFWVFYLFLSRANSFFFFLFFYSLILFLILFIRSKSPEGICNSKNFNSLLSILTFIFLCGLPPMSLFFFKIELIHFLTFGWSVISLFFVFLFRFISLFGYLSFFFKNFFLLEFLYCNNDFSFKKISFLIGTLLGSFLFFI